MALLPGLLDLTLPPEVLCGGAISIPISQLGKLRPGERICGESGPGGQSLGHHRPRTASAVSAEPASRERAGCVPDAPTLSLQRNLICAHWGRGWVSRPLLLF